MKKIFIVLTLMAVLVSGCGVQKRDPADKKTFLLNIERPNTDPTVSQSACLSIASCKIASPFGGRSLVYRTGPVQYEQDYYNLFLTSPNIQITEAMQKWFHSAGFARCHSVDGGINSETFIWLDTDVDVFRTDFEHIEKPVSSVRMRVRIAYHSDDLEDEVVISKTFSADSALPAKPTAGQVVEGLSDCLTQIFQELENVLIAEK